MRGSSGVIRGTATAIAMVLVFAGACSSDRSAAPAGTREAGITQNRPACDEDDGGLTLPEGLCASIFADNLGHARHIAVAPNGDVYVNTFSDSHNGFTNAPGGFLVALRDKDRDGHAEITQRFGPSFEPGQAGGGTGIAIYRGGLFVESRGAIVRYALAGESPVPSASPEVVLSGLPIDGDHQMHPFAIASDGTLYVNSGSASNSCQENNRTLESPGRNPCPELATRAGIWRYQADQTGQQFSPLERVVTGARNTVALAVRPENNALYLAIHGRDQLGDNWPRLYKKEQDNEVPAETLVRVDQGQDFGWPNCYFDTRQSKYVLAPEYGGDGGRAVGSCNQKTRPLLTFPAHWAPEAIAFASNATWPSPYQNGLFVSFHGSWNRTPPQAGFLVAFVPFVNDAPGLTYVEFATGFAGPTLPADPKLAPHRPMGLAVGPDGALFVSDDVAGRVWRIAPRR